KARPSVTKTYSSRKEKENRRPFGMPTPVSVDNSPTSVNEGRDDVVSNTSDGPKWFVEAVKFFSKNGSGGEWNRCVDDWVSCKVKFQFGQGEKKVCLIPLLMTRSHCLHISVCPQLDDPKRLHGGSNELAPTQAYLKS